MVDATGGSGGTGIETTRSISYESAPVGIKIYCVISGLATAYLVLLSFGLMGAGGAGVVLGVLFLALSVGLLAVLWGLWTLKPWAWTWGMILFGLSLVLDLLRVNLLGVLISALLLAYLASKRDLHRGW